MSYDTLPFAPTIPVEPFAPRVSQAAIDDLTRRLENDAPRAVTWENSTGPSHLGVRAQWIDDAVRFWKDDFNWREVEAEIATVPGFMATVTHGKHTYRVHFLALFSQRPDAVPIVFCHGWPGSVLEFLPMLQLAKGKHSPADLPNHIIVPALIGYGFSSPPPLDGPFSAKENAEIFDTMLTGLGFGRKGGHGTGYLVQGGDVGSFVARHCARFESCRGIHINFFPLLGVRGLKTDDLDELDKRAMRRATGWERWGQGYYIEHATKPATIGAVLESSPVALLTWIGEKLYHPKIQGSLHFTVAEVSLYWLTHSAATCLWQYRAGSGKDFDKSVQPPKRIDKPTGYSQFLSEAYPTPIEWVRKRTNLVWARRHIEGGHFAALEKPAAMWDDLQDFAKVVLQDKARL